MPARKGQASAAYKEGRLDQYNFANDREWASECGKKGIKKAQEARKRNKKLKEDLSILLNMGVKNPKYIKALEEVGIDHGDMTNQVLLMVVLMKKGFSGDVAAIRQIAEMMEEYGIEKEAKETQGMVINVFPRPKKEDESEW